MELQGIIVGIVLILAVVSAAAMFIRKSKAFVPGPNCEDDCGCSSSTKTKSIN